MRHWPLGKLKKSPRDEYRLKNPHISGLLVRSYEYEYGPTTVAWITTTRDAADRDDV
eukprot:COSAG01_NODE_14631_length_1429_cov_1.544361_2_plen_56_part_01